MSDNSIIADHPEINQTGKAMFVRDADGELQIVKPGQRLPLVSKPTPSAAEVVANNAAAAGEKDGFFTGPPRRSDPAAGGPSRTTSDSDANPIFAAARKGDDDAVRKACQADREAVKVKDHLERTALHMAAYAGHASTVELLLAFDAHHSALACDATMPLHFAAQNGHIEVCKLLLKAGAKVNARGTKRNDTPLHLCCFKGHVGCVEYLLKKNADGRLKNRAQRTPADVATSDEIKELLAAAAQRKQNRSAHLTGPLACTDGDDGDATEASAVHDKKRPKFDK